MTEREGIVMSTIQYNKLVRDRIPEIIEASGKRCVCSALSDEEYLAKLDEKLNEELAEYQESKSMEELADLLEVIRAVATARGSSIEEVEAIRRDKAAKRGGFEKKILLTEVIADD
jgi:predicted house-cleaning noncanonical NTP pyrophosphatase (MazG superfamily)